MAGANRLRRAPIEAVTRCFDIACPSCGNADARTYAWCRKRVFELVCGACGYAYDADEHGADLRAGVRVGLPHPPGVSSPRQSKASGH